MRVHRGDKIHGIEWSRLNITIILNLTKSLLLKIKPSKGTTHTYTALEPKFQWKLCLCPFEILTLQSSYGQLEVYFRSDQFLNFCNISVLNALFLCLRIERSGAYSFWPVRPSVCLSVCKTFNIGHIFWMVSDRTFIFHMCVPYDKTFLLVPNFLTLWPWPWSLTHFSKNFNIGHIFWMASDRAFIFHMCVPYDKNFLMVP
jgi:hypothetical protein